jgi:pimeloyl-ACP methyl ester carboxylesterase
LNAKPNVKESTYKIAFDENLEVELHVTERGEGRPFLLLHGGAGPISVSHFADMFAEHHEVRVITPIHPGFSRTPRPDYLNNVQGLARLYAGLLDELNLKEVTVIGNSIGGWIACELALLARPEVSMIVLVDAVGIEVADHPVTDISNMATDQLMRLSYHDPSRFRVDPARLTDEQRANMAANRATLLIYAGPKGVDSGLAGRLPKIAIPVLVLWGESDGIVDKEYAKAFASAIPRSRFVVLSGAGHVPQIETPEALMETIWKATTNSN